MPVVARVTEPQCWQPPPPAQCSAWNLTSTRPSSRTPATVARRTLLQDAGSTSCAQIWTPCQSSLGRVDLVVSLQVVEHLWALRRFLSECVRVLAPGGRCVISTPNRLTFSPGLSRGEKPTNPFHVEEFDAEQLTDLMIEAGMSNVSCLGLHHGQRLTTWERGNGPIVRALVEQAQSERAFDDWPRALRELVMSVETRDFTLSTSALESSIDLVAIGDAPLSEGSDRP